MQQGQRKVDEPTLGATAQLGADGPALGVENSFPVWKERGEGESTESRGCLLLEMCLPKGALVVAPTSRWQRVVRTHSD
jgi:hypothetical protein